MSKLQPNNGELVEDKKEVNRYLQSQANAGLEQIQKRWDLWTHLSQASRVVSSYI